ncbi:GNAT family N-acetyltransferase [Massilia sp. RP-1-19]|uniref:GNAT family N-acetyltransferase n=1 Tax=Massilia polaris TaxID=2728846 RepID=A0A848HI74_9BURK|nr:GNAT family N-acetyltransferase [Massilia polaris]NML60914.1 GNAT family N-acetyltransferase [Massilia polaris]
MRPTTSIRHITPEAFGEVRSQLSNLLLDTVALGASIGFLASIDAIEADAYWRGVEAAVAEGTRLLLVAEAGGEVLGSVQLDLCQRKNGANRAEVQKLIVHGAARRQGVASALMKAVEQEALARERGVLFLDTEAGAPAEVLYRGLGYTFIGGIPEYACTPGGRWTSNAIYYKTLFSRNGQGQA